MELKKLELKWFAQNYTQSLCQRQELNPYTRCLMPEPQPQGHPIFFSDHFILNKTYYATESSRGVAHNHTETLRPTHPGSNICIKLK